MDWSLANYNGHPIDGEATLVAASAGRLNGVASEIRALIAKIGGLGTVNDFWQSTSGSADKLQTALDELPAKLRLIATRYATVSKALDEFHPVLASTRQDAEYWIVQAETAHSEATRAQAGVGEMEQHESSGDGDLWDGEDYRANLETAEADLERAVANVHNAVDAFESAADVCADAILDACDDDLQDHTAFLGINPFSTRRAEDSNIFGDIGSFIEGVLDSLFGPRPYRHGDGGTVSDEELEEIMRGTEYRDIVDDGIPPFEHEDIDDGYFSGAANEAEQEMFSRYSQIYKQMAGQNSEGVRYIVDYLEDKYHLDTGVMSPNPGDNTPANALKHVEFEAILTVFYGPTAAKEILDAHENIVGGENRGDVYHSSLMDLYNNNVGIEIGKDILENLETNRDMSGGLFPPDTLGASSFEGFDPTREGEYLIDVSVEDAGGDLVDLIEVQNTIAHRVEQTYEDETAIWRTEDNWGYGH